MRRRWRRRLVPIFAALAPGIENIPRTTGREKIGGTAKHGYLRCGPNGASHFVKMAHNGIEYGVMAAYAEGAHCIAYPMLNRSRRILWVVTGAEKTGCLLGFVTPMIQFPPAGFDVRGRW